MRCLTLLGLAAAVTLTAQVWLPRQTLAVYSDLPVGAAMEIIGGGNCYQQFFTSCDIDECGDICKGFSHECDESEAYQHDLYEHAVGGQTTGKVSTSVIGYMVCQRYYCAVNCVPVGNDWTCEFSTYYIGPINKPKTAPSGADDPGV